MSSTLEPSVDHEWRCLNCYCVNPLELESCESCSAHRDASEDCIKQVHRLLVGRWIYSTLRTSTFLSFEIFPQPCTGLPYLAAPTYLAALSCCTGLHRPARLLVWAALSCCTGLGTSIALRRFTLYGTGCRRLMYSSTRAKWTRRERFLTLHWLLKARTRPERHVQTRSSLEHFLSKLVSMAGCVSEQPVCEPVAELG